MNSKECLEKLTYCVNGMESQEKYYKIIKQDLDRLEKLEKEHNKLKERYKHRAETSNDLCKAVKQYEKAFEILQDILLFEINNYEENNKKYYYIALYSKNDKSYLDRNKISKEQYELLKEVLGNE